MRYRAGRALPAFVLLLAAGFAAGGCSTATAGSAAGTGASASGTGASASGSAAGTGASASGSATATAGSATARASAPVYGPPGPDPACAAALKAEQTLRTRQGKDQSDESALDQDFMNFAGTLSASAQRETHPAKAKAMSALANDYTDLVESQSGAAQLPDMSTVQSDGAAFDKACSLP
jgi:hypothetical protein